VNGVRFYEEFQSHSKKHTQGNCIAVLYSNGTFLSGNYDAIGAVYFMPNSPVASTSVGMDYLRLNCKRVSETHAREVHPELFAYLDD